MTFGNAYRNARVLVTGHTGFKGAWLTSWLKGLGAEVKGISLSSNQPENQLFQSLDLKSEIQHCECDIRNFDQLHSEVREFQPQFVFHLAAQSLVRQSYASPKETYETNIMGTVNLLEALRQSQSCPCWLVVVTTDKCYDNREWVHSYREIDSLGGHDPYSSSKGAAEIVAHGYRKSYFSNKGSLVSLATARAGNVIGGGDWAADRIVPDCIRALQQSRPIGVRNKIATRPWQHVLEPLSGYLWLALALAGQASLPYSHETYQSAFNFGPNLDSNRTVMDLVREILKHWPGDWQDESDPNALHEATLLNLSTDKSYHFLRWRPVWHFENAVLNTVGWYRDTLLEKIPARIVTESQITRYTSAAKEAGTAWSTLEEISK